jgi:hypothetical protein
MTTRRQENRQSNLLIRLPLVVVFTGAYLALAVLGRGGIAALFAQPALIALTIATGGAVWYGICRRRWGNDGARAKRQPPVRE